MSKEHDPDLPGDETFKPLPSVVEVQIGMGPGLPPASAMGMILSPEAQAAIHHNRLRYAELNMLRMGLANEYARTKYRH